MFLRWEIIRGWMPGIVFAAIAVAIEILYFEYMLSRGLADETFSVSLGIVSLPLSISLFLSLGNAIVLLVLWMSVFESTAYVMAGPDRSGVLWEAAGSSPIDDDPCHNPRALKHGSCLQQTLRS